MRRSLALALFAFLLPVPSANAELKLLLPLGRTAYQTNEAIDLAIVRSASRPLPASKMTVTLSGDDGSRVECVFAAKPIEISGADAHATEHLRLNGSLLRPGKYVLEVSADGASAKTGIGIYSHIRKTSFRLIDWASHAKDKEQALLGEDGMGFNLIYAAYGGISPDNLIRGGLDYMRCCTMGGGHQMDLRTECDWSDPYALVGAEARVVREALACRVNPNAVGVHFYDEPGLTWMKHPKTGVASPYNLPPQDRTYKSAFGFDPIQYFDVKPEDPAAVARWNEMNRWKFSFLDAAWKYSSFGVSYVRPDLLSANQSVYGFSAYADGYYWNVVRSLPVISGHGGYDDWGPGYWNPSWTFEMGRMRDLTKPNWYLPMWHSNMPANQYRMEMWLSFMMNLQGLAKPPDTKIQNPQDTPACADAVLEVNKLAQRLGTIFTTMPVDRGDVAVLYSISQIQHAQVRDMQKDLNCSAYEGGGHSRAKILLAYEAGKQIHINLFPIVEEDILDGTLAAHHKALVIPGVDYLEPNVVSSLEAWIESGGAVLPSDDCKVRIKGAQKIGVALSTEAADRIAALHKAGKADEANKLETTDYYPQAAAPFARALKAKLAALHITPALDADSPYIITSRQAYGDVEYLFAVNATYDPAEGKRNSIKQVRATVFMPSDGRPVYDAIRAGELPPYVEQGRLAHTLSFGPGQMCVFARTARPIAGVGVQTPTICRDYTLARNPIHVDISANVIDDKGKVIAGSIPLRLRVIDPLGQTRYELYRATDHGIVNLTLPLAANDPAGLWNVTVEELLSSKSAHASFTYQPAPQCGAVAGLVPRAIYFGNDRENAFRFFRVHQDLTIVKGSSDYNNAPAERLKAILKPWNIRCTIVTAAEANKPRQMSPEEIPTWTGLEPGRLDAKSPPNPNQVGFNLRGPAILLGTPEDNPLIKFALEKNFLPYQPDMLDFPGRSRGYLSWQRDAIAYGNESITLVAYDAAGMSEAVGSLYESAAAIDPLMSTIPPSVATITPASKSIARGPEMKQAWRIFLSDRAVSMKAANQLGVGIITNDGEGFMVDPTGKINDAGKVAAPAILAPPPPKLPDAIAKNLLPDRIPKFAAAHGGYTAVAYWGGALELFDKSGAVRASQQLDFDVAGLVWLGDVLVVGMSDGSVVGLR